MSRHSLVPNGEGLFSIMVDDDPQDLAEAREVLARIGAMPSFEREALLAVVAGRRGAPDFPTPARVAESRKTSSKDVRQIGEAVLKHLQRDFADHE